MSNKQSRKRLSRLVDRFYDFKTAYEEHGGCYGRHLRMPYYIEGDDPIKSMVSQFGETIRTTARVSREFSKGWDVSRAPIGPMGVVLRFVDRKAEENFLPRELDSAMPLLDTGRLDDILISNELAHAIRSTDKMDDRSWTRAVEENGGRRISRHAASLALLDLESRRAGKPGDQYLSIIFELASALDGKRADGVSSIIRNEV